MKKCPFCAEEIQDEAIKCRHCGSNLEISSSQQSSQPPKGGFKLPNISPILIIASLVILCLLAGGLYYWRTISKNRPKLETLDQLSLKISSIRIPGIRSHFSAFLAEKYYEIGQSEKALSILQQAVIDETRIEEDYALPAIAKAYIKIGKNEEAEKIFKTAQDISDNYNIYKDIVCVSKLLNKSVDIPIILSADYVNWQKMSDCIDLKPVNSCIDLLPSIKDTPSNSKADYLLDIALKEVKANNYEEASRFATQAEQILFMKYDTSNLSLEDQLEYAAGLLSLGQRLAKLAHVYVIINKPELAKSLLNRDINNIEKGTVMLNMANAYITINKTSEAGPYLKEAYSIADKVDSSDSDRVEMLCRIAEQYLSIGENSKAIDIIQRELTLINNINSESTKSSSIAAISRVFLKSKKTDLSMKLISEAINFANSCDSNMYETCIWFVEKNFFEEQVTSDEACCCNTGTKRDADLRNYPENTRGGPMVEVPAGSFWMGSPDYSYFNDSLPAHKVFLDTYFIDKYEVSQGSYRRCVNDGKCRPRSFDHPSFPQDSVTWEDAKTFCEWAGKRLPTEAEWEKAARGTDGRLFPWGSRLKEDKANFCDKNCDEEHINIKYDDGYKNKAFIYEFSEGASPYGAYNMAGNVAEWVADWYDPKYYSKSSNTNPSGPPDGKEKVLRGGGIPFS